MLVHFYSPVPEIADLAARRVWSPKIELAGIDFRPGAQLDRLAALGREFGAECQWPHASPGDDTRFCTNNSRFSYGRAAATRMLIRRFKPRRVIEVGSGSSSRVIASALRRNADEGGAPAEYIDVDPYPKESLRRVPGITRIVQDWVELVDPGLFEQLRENDVLFVDSGHTVRIGGDVNFLVLDVLPRLAPGVLAHFHDIPMPYEYAEVYFTDPNSGCAAPNAIFSRHFSRTRALTRSSWLSTSSCWTIRRNFEQRFRTTVRRFTNVQATALGYGARDDSGAL
jgi:hypothetical protein